MRAIDPIVDKLFFVFIGALVAWLLQQYRVARAEDVSFINEHIKDIEKFCDAAQAYWLKSPSDKNEELALAAKVRATHAATTLSYDTVARMCGRGGGVYRSLSVELFNEATGGSFEGDSRQLDPERAIRVHDASAKLIAHLRACRKDMLSLKRLITG